ncbi:hypothetical protein PVK06_017692 [Gossypium arboreum]|uniref:Reverse transcriptase zinc-binding domain-containing protein n=1 Tax=Gossypium arboreum TaxID=29729 RepID=A0ABR0Q3C3_GOSAR|nr:hypothetical protein PVK06_017692 [Gossypium arboreum]
MEDGAWDLEAFKEKVPEKIVKQIVSIPPPHPLIGPDKIFWPRTANGDFSIKNAYHMLKKATWNEKDSRWKTVWKYQGPHRVRFFLWLTCKQRLLTNQERVRKGIGQNMSCLIFQYDTEDILHVLRDCSTTKDVWKYFVLKSCQELFFSNNILDWVNANLDSSSWTLRNGVP